MSSDTIQVLDGGMGTTLESLGADVSTPLWGCDLLQTNPEIIESVHSGFHDAGAGLIQTATYQLTLPGLCSHAKVDEAAGGEIMRSAIPLASGSKSSNGESRGTVLSIGPFGATLSPSQEYKGIYPPPYGPSTSSSNYPSDPLPCIDALAQFHLDRLKVYAEDEEVWRLIDWIAFETVPLLTEYQAIRRAMTRLKEEMGRGKRFWITSAWPEGKHPQFNEQGEHVSVRKVLEAALVGEDLPANGVGLNCTNPSYIHALSTEFSEKMKDLVTEEKVRGGEVTFVLYPDGGSVYDTVTRTWSSGGLDPESWGRQVSNQARLIHSATMDSQKLWKGVIVGGCCKSGFREIKALSAGLNE